MQGTSVTTDISYNSYPITFSQVVSIVVNFTDTSPAGNSAGYYHKTKNITTSYATIQYYYATAACPFHAIILGY